MLYCQQYLEQVKTLAIPNKHTKTYLTLCEKAANRAETKEQGRTTLNLPIESHHVLPKCFNLGGKRDKENLVHFTLREHFVSHLLLTKMFIGKHKQQMISALVLMCIQGNYVEYGSSRIYERLRAFFYTDDWKIEQSERAKKQWADPVMRELVRKTTKERASTPEALERSRKAASLQMSDPHQREIVSKRMKGRIRMFNSKLNKIKTIPPEQQVSLEEQGYFRMKKKEKINHKGPPIELAMCDFCKCNKVKKIGRKFCSARCSALARWSNHP